MTHAELVKILCCPETHQPLTMADAALVQQLNERIEDGQLSNRADLPVKEKIDAGLVRDDRKYLYPIRQEIPIMLIDEAIPLES
jgi:uncharacterized protein YbaR (Trm112 family)